jgi:septal ring factor EnvC (AmiA/AmiB activator)
MDKEKVEKKVDTYSMFGLMNALLENTPVTAPESNPIKFSNEEEANQALSKLRTHVDEAQLDYLEASWAYSKNKRSQFRRKLEVTTAKLEKSKKRLSQLEQFVKQTKEQKDMYTF